MTQKIYVASDGTEFRSKQSVDDYHAALKIQDAAFAEKRKEFLVIQENLAKALEARIIFQEECPHEYVQVESFSDTGNYDPSEDSYWFEIVCKCCNGRWNEDQETSQYKGNNNPKVEFIGRK